MGVEAQNMHRGQDMSLHRGVCALVFGNLPWLPEIPKEPSFLPEFPLRNPFLSQPLL